MWTWLREWVTTVGLASVPMSAFALYFFVCGCGLLRRRKEPEGEEQRRERIFIPWGDIAIVFVIVAALVIAAVLAAG